MFCMHVQSLLCSWTCLAARREGDGQLVKAVSDGRDSSWVLGWHACQGPRTCGQWTATFISHSHSTVIHSTASQHTGSYVLSSGVGQIQIYKCADCSAEQDPTNFGAIHSEEQFCSSSEQQKARMKGNKDWCPSITLLLNGLHICKSSAEVTL